MAELKFNSFILDEKEKQKSFGYSAYSYHPLWNVLLKDAKSKSKKTKNNKIKNDNN